MKNKTYQKIASKVDPAIREKFEKKVVPKVLVKLEQISKKSLARYGNIALNELE